MWYPIRKLYPFLKDFHVTLLPLQDGIANIRSDLFERGKLSKSGSPKLLLLWLFENVGSTCKCLGRLECKFAKVETTALGIRDMTRMPIFPHNCHQHLSFRLERADCCLRVTLLKMWAVIGLTLLPSSHKTANYFSCLTFKMPISYKDMLEYRLVLNRTVHSSRHSNRHSASFNQNQQPTSNERKTQ